MTTKQEHKFNMYLTVRDFLSSNETVTTGLPGFAENLAILKDAINSIQLSGEHQKSDLTGISKQKSQVREVLVNMAADNSAKVAALAKHGNDLRLLSEVKFKRSDLAKVTDVALKDYSQIIYDKAQTNLEALSKYGINADTQKAFADAIEAYNASIARPRVGITEKTQATRELVALFDSADSAISNIDYSVEIVRVNQPGFFNGYRTARRLVETSSGKLSLKAIASESGSGEPVRGVTFSFSQNGNRSSRAPGNGDIVKRTANKGMFNVKNMPSGTYQVVVSKPGYKEKTVTVSIADGEMAVLRVEMEKG